MKLGSILRIATRESPLALWQAEDVRQRLIAAHTGLVVELVPMSTSGDNFLAGPLNAAESGGKGLFVKELEAALLEGRADLAVHSMKDVPVQQPEGLVVDVFLAAEDPFDALVSNDYANIDSLPVGAKIGTVSLRRKMQLLAQRPDLDVQLLRGNVQTRLRKLDEGQFAAILLACAGLKRLGLEGRIRQRLTHFVPAIGQGIVGIEYRANDGVTAALLAPLHNQHSAQRLAAERAFNAAMGGSCQAPLGAHAVISGDTLRLEAVYGTEDRLWRKSVSGSVAEGAALGRALAGRMVCKPSSPAP
jgi:hydroxymethylbilane synthase